MLGSVFDWKTSSRATAMPASVRSIIGRTATMEAHRVAAELPGNVETPLIELPELAAELGIAHLQYKDEGLRCGIGNFKAVGAAYAVYCVLADRVQSATGVRPVMADLLAGRNTAEVAEVTLAAATAGSHGRAVAWAAQMFGAKARIVIHQGVDEDRATAIRRYGADVERFAGTYDEASRYVNGQAQRNGWTIVSDTAVRPGETIPIQIMQGYTTIAKEIISSTSEGKLPTHVFVQAGVGALAAALCGAFWDSWGEQRPIFCVVEPASAACLLLSAQRGALTESAAPAVSGMIGLAAGRPSDPAWEVLAAGADAFIAVSESDAIAALAVAEADTALAAAHPTLSAIAGLAGLMRALGDPVLRDRIQLTPESRVVVIGTDRDPRLDAKN